MSAQTFTSDADLFADLLVERRDAPPRALDFDPLFSDASPGDTLIYEPQPHGGALQRNRTGYSDAESTNQFPWPPKLCLELALGFDSEEEILERHGIDSETYERFKRLPAFRRDLAMAMTTIRDEGLTFKAKCRIFSEEYLDEIYSQIFDRSVGVAQRFEMFKQLVKLGGLEPKEEKAKADEFAGLPRIAIQINL